ncbi:Circadian clock protein kinase KaiC [Bradyrhizobium sp. ORS 278]|uniref:circadian clock protein KaiC n=1 Tax=Bradyrhizobium sp. (strain ORS 278) TaxID=114615 RepID=UPI000150802B|nr:circadian clock protein KaiC [Bradyrhizobium sp. ORS 278]CAL77736.1 Circadian clock protein kinase KaiC [Bradyrhizobium sp. ORS 278]
MALTGAHELEKLRTGIAGFDQIANGGLPLNRTTLVAGTAGSGKTVLALQYLITGVRTTGEHGVCVTFEEAPEDLIRNIRSFGWELENMIARRQVAIVDVTPEDGEETIEAGTFDFSALLARIEAAVRNVNAKRLIMDSIGALFPQFSDANLVRRELHRITVRLRQLGVTSMITVERPGEDGPLARFGIEEFVADNVLVLRNRLEHEKRRRTIEILKFRGATHHKGEYPFTVDHADGITILPLSAMELQQHSSDIRVSSGVPELDAMCGGGIYRDSVILVSGATGTGKTLMVTHYLQAAIASGQRAMLIAAEESRDQLTRNALNWGMDFDAAERSGMLRIVARYPETMGLEDHLLYIRREMADFRPDRIAVDSLSAFERAGTIKSYREFVVALTSGIKQFGVTGLFTNTTAMLLGGESVTESHISTITDMIVLLRYVELHGEMRRGLAVLKMRGTQHDKDIREYVIDGGGMHLREPFREIHGILSGAPTYTFARERDNLAGMFEMPRTRD